MIKSVKIQSVSFRVLLIIACLTSLTMIFFFVRWCFGYTIAAYAPAKEVAEWAIDLAPKDPQTHYATAVLAEKSFVPEDLAQSLAEYESAAALAPRDYRLWMALGKARERDGNATGAELAYRKSLELAPNYSPVRWTLGNALLRQGKTDEAFEKIVKAAEADPNYRLPAVSTAWQIFEGDVQAVQRHLGNSVSVNFALAAFLAKQKRFDEAVQVWKSLPAENKKNEYKSDGEKLFSEMLAAKKFRDALQIQQSISDKPENENYTFGKIYNGSFEMPLARENAGVFDWQIADGGQPQIGPNNEHKSAGATSLFLIFNSSDGRDFRQISQIIAVESNRKYNLEFFYKSELKTSATVRWEVVDVVEGKVLAAGNPIASSADWTKSVVEFETKAATEAIVVRLAREECKSIVCPISGKVWFDDFQLK